MGVAKALFSSVRHMATNTLARRCGVLLCESTERARPISCEILTNGSALSDVSKAPDANLRRQREALLVAHTRNRQVVVVRTASYSNED